MVASERHRMPAETCSKEVSARADSLLGVPAPEVYMHGLFCV